MPGYLVLIVKLDVASIRGDATIFQSLLDISAEKQRALDDVS
jgi:hypothetical protein